MRIGLGWDIHRLKEGRPLIIGGVTVPSDKGEDAHSDGDVLLHALIDAILGAMALGDIGTYFPPSDDRWKGISSEILLMKTLELIESYEIGNLDATIIIETPKLKEWKEPIKKNLSRLLSLDTSKISVKAKTHEKVDAVGKGEAIEASVVVLLKERNSST